MKPLGIAVSVAGLLATVSAFIGNAAGRFDQKLSIERQILHVTTDFRDVLGELVRRHLGQP